MTDIAIVGIDCRFPGADNPAELWDLLISAGDGVGDVPPARWRAADFFDPGGGPDATNTCSAGFVTDPDVFDRAFFGLSEEAAATADPQVRLLLHTAWRAFEDACLDPRGQAGSRTGVYVGIMGSDWLSLVMTDFPAMTRHVPGGNGYAMTANRISYELDLRGPSMAIDTFCSSSLVAAEYACASLRSGETDQALVGGVNLFVTPATSIVITQCGLSSPDGRCKPFSSEANGFGRAEGVAVIVLRRLADALADGLPIYAVIKGGAVNHGGRSSTVTAPNPRAQQRVVAEAYERARVLPRDITFVEAHGSGTVVGDRMEVRALGGVHGVPRDQPCALGSIKGNIAHAEGAAGVAGLVKAALALRHGVVPPSRYADSENPRLRLADNGLMLLREPLKLPEGEVLAGVSSFGLGGTNAHLVLGSAPPLHEAPARRGDGLLTVSSNDVAGLRTAVRALAADLSAQPRERAARIAWTSNRVKSSGDVRFALPITDPDLAVTALAEAIVDDGRLDALSGRRGKVATGWLVPGEGTEFPGMSAELYERCAPYRRALAVVDEALAPGLGASLRDLLLSGTESIHRPELARATLFGVAFAVGRVLRELGVQPLWLFGRGTGVYAAAALAGVFDLTDACRLVTARDRHTGLAEAARRVAFRSPAAPLYTARGPRGAEVTGAVHWSTDPLPAGPLGDEVEGALPTGHTHVIALGPPSPGARTVGGRVVPPPVPPAGAAATGFELLDALAVLYRDGLDPSWEALYEPDQRILQRLTPYEFATSARSWKHATVSGREIGSAP